LIQPDSLGRRAAIAFHAGSAIEYFTWLITTLTMTPWGSLTYIRICRREMAFTLPGGETDGAATEYAT